MEAIAFGLGPDQAIQLTSCGAPLSRNNGPIVWLDGGPNQRQWPPCWGRARQMHQLTILSSIMALYLAVYQ